VTKQNPFSHLLMTSPRLLISMYTQTGSRVAANTFARVNATSWTCV